MENEHLVHCWNHLRLVDHQTRHGVGRLVGKGPVGCPVEVADRHGPVDEKLIVLGLADGMFAIGVEFVGDFAHDLFENILQCDQPLKRAVFVHDQREMAAHPQELPHLVVERRGLGHEIRLPRDAAHVEIAKFGGPAFGPGGQRVHGAQQILGMHDADDVVGVVAIERQARVVALEALIEDRFRIGHGVDHLDLRAVQHDLLDGAFAQIQRAQHAVAVLFLDHTLGLAQKERAGDLFAHRKNMTVRVGLDPEKPQDDTHEPAHGGHDRRKDLDHHEDDRCGARGGAFRVCDGIGLGQHLGEHQHQKRHHQCRQRHPAFPEEPGEERCGKRRGEDIHQVVAQKDRPDQRLVVLGDAQRGLRPRGALFGLRPQLAARCGGQRGFAAREIPRKHEKHQDRCRDYPECHVERGLRRVHVVSYPF